MSEASQKSVAPRARFIAEIASALAVLISLLFLGWEVRQNTEQAALNARAVEVEVYQSLISQINELNRLSIESPEVVILVEAYVADPSGYSVEQAQQAQAYLYLLFRHGDMAYYQFEKGLLSEERLRSVIGPLSGRIDWPGMDREWAERRDGFTEGYRNFIDGMIAGVNEGD